MDRYSALIELLDRHQASYRLIDHDPEGRTGLVSAMRGHPVGQAAKCMVVLVKIGRKSRRFVLAVVPGDCKVDLEAIKALFGGTYASFAAPDVAEELAGSAVGTVLPFSFDARLELIVDPALLTQAEIFFNAARLERSLALSSADYVRIAQPRIENIGATL